MIRRILSWVVIVVLFALAAAILLPSLLGYERYVITSGSMTGTIDKGSVAYDEIVPADSLKVGDIITFVPPKEFGIDEPVTHRIVKIEYRDESGQRFYRTKGDANEDMDPWEAVLDEDEVARNVFDIPYIGYIYMALRVPWVRMLVIALPALLIAISVVVALWRSAGEEARRENEAAEAEAEAAKAVAARETETV